MGGKEASRGFLYQGFASVLEALTDKGNWDKIYVEFPTSNDKVDIALEQQNQIVKCIQVKSTINTFTKSDIKIWLDDLIKDIESPEYELFLIGQCDKSANTFIKSIEKYYGKVLDKEAKSSLNGFDTDLLDNKRIRFFILPFEIEVLEKIVRDSLHQYISDSNQMMTFDQIRFIASATVNDQMISSTHGKGIDRKDFDEEMEKRIFLVADKYSPKRISIGVKSFTRGAENLEKDTESCLSFINKFDGRNIKGEYDWNKDIYRNLEEFLLTNTSNKYAYQIFLDTHASIAFAAGRILDSKSGINVFPIQKSSTNGTVLWDVKLSSKRNYTNWDISQEKFNENQYDSALVLNVTRNIYNDVVKFIAELDVYKSKPFVYYVKVFKSLSNNILHYTKWGKYLSKTTISPPIIAPWILMNQIPVVNEWQAPETFGELLVACEKQHINIMCILQNIVSKIRDGKWHLLLIGFPVPRIFGGDPEIISWKALYLPTVSYGKRTAKGFRNNQQGWWMRDRCEVFTKNAKLDWIVSENWNQHEISQRGKMSDLLLRKKILLIGAGCIGASIAEIFVRAGVYNITIADSDIFEVGNLSRHILNLNNIGEFKELSVCNYLNSINPHANVDVINDTLSNNNSFKTNIDLDRYDVIVDCTGENNVLDILQRTNFKRTHIIASVSVGLGAKRLYVTLMNGNTFNFNAFYDLISPYLQAEKVLYDDYDLPRNGIGCWHPTFPGRSDDIWIAAATSVKVIENYIISKSQKTLSLIYEQKESDGIFESYEVVEKRENG